MSCIIDVLGPPRKKWPLEGDELDARWEELRNQGWRQPLALAIDDTVGVMDRPDNALEIASIAPMANGEVWMVTKAGEVVAWRFHRDIAVALFISISSNVDSGYEP
jgi:hypothetical protein